LSAGTIVFNALLAVEFGDLGLICGALSGLGYGAIFASLPPPSVKG